VLLTENDLKTTIDDARDTVVTLLTTIDTDLGALLDSNNTLLTSIDDHLDLADTGLKQMLDAAQDTIMDSLTDLQTDVNTHQDVT